MLLIDCLFQLFYSFVNIPYGSLAAAMTQDSLDRSRLSGARSIASAVTGVALAAIISPQFQGIAEKPIEQVRWQFTVTTAILGVLAIALYLVCFANTREVVPRSPGKVRLANTLKMVRQNRPLLTLCAGAFFLLGAMFTMNAVAMYYTRAVLGNASFFTFLMLAQTVGTIAAASFVPAMTVKLGKRKGYVTFATVAVLGYVLAALVPQGGQALIAAVIAWFVFGIGSGGTNALMFSMQADTVDYGEWKTGTRSEGGSYSILSMVRKTGQGLGGAIGGTVIAAFGYNPKAVEQTAEALQGLRVATGWVPAALGVVAALVILFYPLTEDAHRALVIDLAERRETAAKPVVTVEQPVITFFEQYGSGADYIAARVAERFGVPYLTQAFSSEQLETAGAELVSEESALDKFMRNLTFTGTTDADIARGDHARADHDLAMENSDTVLNAVRDTGGVILGRNATFVLAQQPRALHVRLTAPVATRVARAAEMDGISEDVATKRQEREDVIRVEMSQRLYGWDPEDDSFYDLIVNTGTYSLDEAVELIVSAYRVKYPA